MRNIQTATLEVGKDGPYVVLVLGEVLEGEQQPAMREGFPIHWVSAKQIFMQAYLAACSVELEQKGMGDDGTTASGEPAAG